MITIDKTIVLQKFRDANKLLSNYSVTHVVSC